MNAKNSSQVPDFFDLRLRPVLIDKYGNTIVQSNENALEASALQGMVGTTSQKNAGILGTVSIGLVDQTGALVIRLHDMIVRTPTLQTPIPMLESLRGPSIFRNGRPVTGRLGHISAYQMSIDMRKQVGKMFESLVKKFYNTTDPDVYASLLLGDDIQTDDTFLGQDA